LWWTAGAVAVIGAGIGIGFYAAARDDGIDDTIRLPPP
jgi:hypothetical protein